ncbi:unnamed protein product, partial [Ectocarpus sp. 4 AP-2014]
AILPNGHSTVPALHRLISSRWSAHHKLCGFRGGRAITCALSPPPPRKSAKLGNYGQTAVPYQQHYWPTLEQGGIHLRRGKFWNSAASRKQSLPSGITSAEHSTTTA